MNIVINKFVNDKIPIIVFGSDNAKSVPVFLMIYVHKDNNNNTTTPPTVSQLSGITKTVTRRGNTIHLNATLYSTYYVIVPIGANITLKNELL